MAGSLVQDQQAREPSEELCGGSLPPTRVDVAPACVQPAPTYTDAQRRVLLSRSWCSWGRRVGDKFRHLSALHRPGLIARHF
eukprot:363328-Chlamydomonas_euryale.AAC.1